MPATSLTAARRAGPARSAAWLLALAGALGPAHPGRTAEAPPAVAQEAGVDPAIRPGDDFFAYANGDWLRSTAIPAGKGKWGASAEITARVQQQLTALLDDADKAPAGTEARKVADFRAAWLDQAAIEAHGLLPLKPQFDRIAAIRDRVGLARYLGSEMPADVDPLNLGHYESAHLLGLAVQEGNHGEPLAVAYLLQGGLGLPDRDSYLGSAPPQQAQRERYAAGLGRLLALLGQRGVGPVSQPARRAAAVMALETEIARSHATPAASADDHNADTVWTRADFAREAPGMDWPAFFAAAGLAGQPRFVAWQPGALKGAAALVARQPLPAWQDYLRIRLVAAHAEVLPRALAAAALALRAPEPAAPETPDARARRARDATLAALGDLIGKLYAARHFPPAAKARVQAIAADVIAAFGRRVEATTWLSPSSREIAMTKLRHIYFGLGTPEQWPDTSGLVIDPADAVGNLRRIARRHTAEALARLGRPMPQTAWCVAPQWPGGMLIFQQHAYNFTAALLQPPKFDAAASDAANYGAIGAIVGHEVSHFVDSLGADYDADGGQRRWWTADDLAGYREATEPLVRQFSAYRALPGVAVDGQAGLTENLADLGGLQAAFDAYRATLAGRAADPDAMRRTDRQFFIGFARAWRARYRDEALAAQAASDHAPENFRVATVRNLDAWYDAFDVTPDQYLYLERRARVRVW